VRSRPRALGWRMSSLAGTRIVIFFEPDVPPNPKSNVKSGSEVRRSQFA